MYTALINICKLKRPILGKQELQRNSLSFSYFSHRGKQVTLKKTPHLI